MNAIAMTIVENGFDIMLLLRPDKLAPFHLGQIFGSGMALTQRVHCAAYGRGSDRERQMGKVVCEYDDPSSAEHSNPFAPVPRNPIPVLNPP